MPSPVWSLPICLDSWTWHSRFLCNIALYSIGLFFHHQAHPQLGVVFALAPSLHSFWSYFSTDLQSHNGHLPTWKVKVESEIAVVSLCDPMDCSLPGSFIHGIFQARILEWVAISFSRRFSQPRDWTWASRIVGRRFTIWATREVQYRPGELTFQCSMFLHVHTVHGLLKARILKWFAIPFSSGPHFARTLHRDPTISGGPTWHGS